MAEHTHSEEIERNGGGGGEVWGGVSYGTQVLCESVAGADSRLCELLAGP